MNAELLNSSNKPEDGFPIPPRPTPYRSFVILITFVLIAIGLMTLPRPSHYFPHVTIDVPGDMQLSFQLNSLKDESSCKRSATTMIRAIQASCPKCILRTLQCDNILSPLQRKEFGETPLTIPSARIPNGIVTYTARQPDLALLACKESERQAAREGDRSKVACYPPGQFRAYTSFEQGLNKQSYNAYTLILTGIGIIIVLLVGFIAYTYRRHIADSTRHSPGPSYPWLEKLTLAGVDTLILLSSFLALAWPSKLDIVDWGRLDMSMVVGHSIIILLTVGWFWLLLEHYSRRRPFWDELREILRVLFIMFMISGAVAFIAGLETASSTHLPVWFLNFILIPLGRTWSRQLLDELGLWQRPAVIIGAGPNAQDAWRAIKSERGMGYTILACLDITHSTDQVSPALINTLDADPIPDVEAHAEINGFPPTLKVLSSEVIKTLQELGEPQVIVALESITSLSSQALISKLTLEHPSIHLIPSIRGLPLFGTELSHFFSHEVLFLTLRNNLARKGYRWVKRAFDLCAAILLLLILSPLFLFLTLRIRKSGGSAYYGHTRIGINGQPFKCLKFRTMRPDADQVLQELLDKDPDARAEWEKDFKLRDDPRITSVGHFLRKTSLDELPQLINVIKGEMSLVGPRPIVAAELERYGEYSVFYVEARPGITGLWQVSGRNDTSYAERVSLDTWYVKNWSLWYDIAILFKTINTVFMRKGAY